MRSLLFKASLLFIILGSVLLISGCNLENFIYGTVTYDGMTDGDDVHVILDTDDNSNEYVTVVTVPVTGGGTTIGYILETIDVPDGSYYLMAAYDSSGDGPDDSEGWDDYAWYGGLFGEPPASANVHVLNGQYDVLIYIPQ